MGRRSRFDRELDDEIQFHIEKNWRLAGCRRGLRMNRRGASLARARE
jgi:hypothetical protein